MSLDRMLLVCAVIFAALWRESLALWRESPVPAVPEHIPALSGSCVVIPCSFQSPSPHRQRKVDVRVRYRGGSFSLRSTAFNSEDDDQVSWDFHGRTSLAGSLADGDCSVKIAKLSAEDSRDYELALKMRGEQWGKGRSVHLSVLDSPEHPAISGTGSVTEGQVVTLNCSIRYSCPSQPPTLLWHWERGAPGNASESGGLEVLQPRDQRPMLLASLSFTASYRVMPRVRCEAVFPGDRRTSVTRDLQVTFSPKDVVVQIHTAIVREGASAFLGCSCKADPPVSEYGWSYTQQGHVVSLPQRTHTVRVYNVTRDMRVRCSARNTIGRSESEPTDLNAQYKPLILPLSSCVVEGLEVLCRCSVDSNPKAAVTWSVNGSVPPSSYNTSVTSLNGTLTAVLTGPMDPLLRVVCFAINSVGNDSHTLLEGGEVASSVLWRVIPATAISLTAFLLSMLLLCCCRRRAGERVLNCRPPAVYPGNLGIYQDRTPLYINCTEVTHIYNNGSYQLVYQNCTPLFVRAKQTRQMARRGGERRGGERQGRGERRGRERRGERRGVARATRETGSPTSTDNDTAIYLEIV